MGRVLGRPAFYGMVAMGQTLFVPPTVAGWPGGSAWFGTSTMLWRMNFAAYLTWVEQFELQRAAQPFAATPDSLLAFYLDRLPAKPFDQSGIAALREFVSPNGQWTGSAEEVRFRGAVRTAEQK